MPQSLARIIVHVVFSTKNRAPYLRDEETRRHLYAYMAGVTQQLDCGPILINGVSDHVHALSCLSRTVTVAQLLEEVKKSSSKWIKSQGPKYGGFYWQAGYGVFSVSLPTSRRFASMWQTKRRITAPCRSRTSFERCAASTAWRLTSVTLGNDAVAEPVVSPRWGSTAPSRPIPQGVALG